MRAFEQLARTTEPGSAQTRRVPDCLEGRAGPVRVFEELARTTEPGSAQTRRVPDCLEGRAGPVRVFEELARTTECGAKQFLIRLEVRAAPFALLRCTPIGDGNTP